jgi:hypothetical protein
MGPGYVTRGIAAIYGFEKSGGAHALVMELVEGGVPENAGI